MWNLFKKTSRHVAPGDFSTPEQAVLSLEAAYRRKDLDACVACKDFRIEAREMLRRLGDGKMAGDDTVIAKTAEVLEFAYRKELRTRGFPNMDGVKSSFEATKPLTDDLYVVTEICTYPDGGSSRQKLLVTKTANGWRVLNPIE
jgi:hypothetical protein